MSRWRGLFLFLMIRRPPRSTQSRSSAASDVYKRQEISCGKHVIHAGGRAIGHILVEHHVRQPPVPVLRMDKGILHDGCLFFRQQRIQVHRSRLPVLQFSPSLPLLPCAPGRFCQPQDSQDPPERPPTPPPRQLDMIEDLRLLLRAEPRLLAYSTSLFFSVRFSSVISLMTALSF